MGDLYDIARQITDEVLGEGTYADLNRGNPDPGVQAAIERAEQGSITCPRCLMTSYNPNDIREGYCGNCHDWTRGSS
jgi:hypothetical protein